MHHFNSLVSEQPLNLANRELTQPARRHQPKRNLRLKIHDAFGPEPDKALECFVDLGLSDADIARYVGLSCECIQILTHRFRRQNITGDVD